MDSLADIDRIGVHLDRQGKLADEFSGVRADDARALVVCFGIYDTKGRQPVSFYVQFVARRADQVEQSVRVRVVSRDVKDCLNHSPGGILKKPF